MHKLNTRLQQLEKIRGGAAVSFLIVSTHDDKNYYANKAGRHYDLDTLDPENLPEGMTHYTQAQLDTQPEGVQVIVITYASRHQTGEIK